jgi:hypothetical protein
MRDNKFHSFKVAFGGVVAALSVMLMLSTGLIPTLTYAIPAIVGALLMTVVIEISPVFAGAIYVAVSTLSLLVVADKEAAVMYAAFFGYYPIIKSFIERKTGKMVSWVVKYIIFNISMIVSYLVVAKVFMITFDDIEFLGKFALPALLFVGNIVFALYDIALTRLVTAYLVVWRKYVKRMFK